MSILATPLSGAEAVNPLAGLAILVGILLAVMVLLRALRKRVMRQRQELPTSTPRERLDQIYSKAASRETLDNGLADAEQLVRRLAAHLDNKAARIEALIEQADARLAQLEGRLGPRGEPGDELWHDPTDPLARQVYDLADAGRSPLEIAQDLDEHLGKVELILKLRRAS